MHSAASFTGVGSKHSMLGVGSTLEGRAGASIKHNQRSAMIGVILAIKVSRVGLRKHTPTTYIYVYT